MKQLHLLSLSLMLMLFCITQANAVGGDSALKNDMNFAAQMNVDSVDDFLELTPRKIRKATGKRLKLKEIIALKVMQRKVKKELRKNSSEPVSKGVYILLALIGLGFVGLGINTDWKGNEWIIGLLLSFICIGGLIYALVKMKNFY